MHPRQVISLGLLLAAIQMCPSASAMEAATAPTDRASNAAILRHITAQRADQLSEVAAMQAKVDRIVTCTGKGKFYTPDESGADADGCSDIEPTVLD